MPRRLPKTVQEIAEVIGRERALFLVGLLPRSYCARRPGFQSYRVHLYVPAVLKPDHILVRLLGWPDAVKMVAHFGGEILYPATCDEIARNHRDDNIRRLARQGLSAATLADWFGMSDRNVRNILREIHQEANDNQCVQHAPTTLTAGAA